MQQATEGIIKIKDTYANPAPLGLIAFGMTTVLLNFHNAGFYSLNTMILAMGIFYGGIGQIIAGIMEWKKNNTLGTTAFCSFGLFWLTFAGLLIMPAMNWGSPPETSALVAYLVMWGIFTGIMFIGTLKLNRALQFIFASLSLLFFLLAIADGTGSSAVKLLAAWEGIICGFSAVYTGLAQVINEYFGRTVWPLGVVKKQNR